MKNFLKNYEEECLWVAIGGIPHLLILLHYIFLCSSCPLPPLTLMSCFPEHLQGDLCDLLCVG